MTTYVSRNAKFRSFGLSLGPITMSPVLPWFSGTTGGSPSYGWRHDHLVTEAWARDAAQCYALRPVYYDNAPLRHGGYYIGGRPKGWTKEDEGDTAQGAWMSPGPEFVTVSGPDIDHFPLSPLLAVYDDGRYYRTEAEAMLRYLGAAHAGMFRTEKGATTWVASHRGASYVLRTAVALGQRGLIAPDDLTLLMGYAEANLLPSWLGPLDKQNGGKGGVEQVYNGVYWLLPAIHDLVRLLSPGKFRRDLRVAEEAMARQVSWLEALVPGKGCAVAKVASWTPDLTAAGVTVDAAYGPWGVRAMDVAGVVTGNGKCRDAARAEAAKWSTDPKAKAWLVSAEGEYL